MSSNKSASSLNQTTSQLETFVRNHFVMVFLSLVASGFVANEAIVRVSGNIRITQTQHEEYLALKDENPKLKEEINQLRERLNKDLVVTIESPSNNTKIPESLAANNGIELKINVQGEIPENKHLWVAVNPEGTNLWYPQTTINVENSEFITKVYSSSGDLTDLYIHIVLTNESAHQQWKEMLKSSPSDEEIPGGAISIKKIKVDIN